MEKLEIIKKITDIKIRINEISFEDHIFRLDIYVNEIIELLFVLMELDINNKDVYRRIYDNLDYVNMKNEVYYAQKSHARAFKTSSTTKSNQEYKVLLVKAKERIQSELRYFD